ncbi:MAG: hypothetical protein ACRDTT_25880 [Pseudonocardiaceae bacterium]
MTATIEVDDHTYRSLEFAARMSHTTAGQVVARLVEEASMPQPAAEDEQPASARLIAIFADYEGHRTRATYDPDTTRVDITSGPLQGSSFKTPTGAARAVVRHYKPKISPNRKRLVLLDPR